MKKKAGILFGLWLAGAVLVGGGCLERLPFSGKEKEVYIVQAASSADIQREIDEVNRKNAEIFKEKKQLEKDSGRIEKNKDDISKVKKESRAIQGEKERAEAERQKQYDIMSKRIKYMYENGSSGYLELLLGADSLSELFNRA